jgi:hypothetical protein
MRRTWTLVLLASLAAGAAGAALFTWSAGRQVRGPRPGAGVQAALERLDERLDAIERRLPAAGGGPALRAMPEPAAPASQAAPDGSAQPDGDRAAQAHAQAKAKAEAPATMDAVRAYLASKLQAERQERRARFQVSVGDAGELDLEDVAAKLGISAEQTDQIRDLYRKEGEQQLEAVFGTRDMQAIRRRIEDAKRDPAAKAKLQDELLQHLMTSLPQIRRAEDAKNGALKELLGPSLYARFHKRPVHEGDVDEFDALLEDVLGTTDPEADGTAPR